MKDIIVTTLLIVFSFNSGWSQNKTYNINDSGILKDNEVPATPAKSLPSFENAKKRELLILIQLFKAMH